MMKQEEVDVVPMRYAMGIWRNYETDAEDTKYNGNVEWWLRSPGVMSNQVVEVNDCGWFIEMVTMSIIVVTVCGPLCI